MKKTILTSVLFLFFFLNYAQGNYIEGVVIDEQLATPIKGAIVTIRGTEFTEGTDNNGKFIFKQALPEGTYNVTVEKENFEEKFLL
ncbi:carboxypeptidase-like regulatory domain-containing protein [Lacinutrix mariniflava]|uniref:carboxypeptidase-like regulatory domain-containing protein n=1 Tax=Lacinutrix mariniflava TaxID=342955 RepID=UPI0006E34945|nr:carboxypeptidase-like regulatory domain-containing protein [Lacinutrix mariniflava]